MDWKRIAEVYSPSRGTTGSGYLIAPGLVLTARHVVAGEGAAPSGDAASVGLRFLDPDQDGLPGDLGSRQTARVIWIGSSDLDVALLEPAEAGVAFRALSGVVALGRLEGRAAVPVDAVGFPGAVASSSRSDFLHIEARADPLSGLRAGVLLLQVGTSRPAEAAGWKGMSGAAVFAADRLIGVVEAVPTSLDDATLRAVPVHRVLDDTEAKALLDSAGLTLPAYLVDAAYVEKMPREGAWDGLRAAYTRAVVTTFCRLDRAGFAVGATDAGRLPALAAFTAQRFTPRSGGVGSSVSAAAVAAERRAVIVGGGGAGKSSVLKQILARAAADTPTSVPIWVPLARLPRDGPLTVARLFDHLVTQADELLGVEVRREFFESLTGDSPAVIGFDALDECGSLARSQQVRDLLIEVAQKWPHCRVFVTSRPEAFRDTPLPAEDGNPVNKDRKFKQFDLAPFNRDDIGPFLNVAFEDGASMATEILNRTGIEALTQTPLTLTLVGLVARADAGLPSNRTELFARCVETVCETWEDAKGTAPGDGLQPAQRIDVLRWLGWEAQCLGVGQLSASEARKAIKQSEEIRSPALAKQALDELGRRSILLRPEMGAGASTELRSLRFTHLQFLEYLAGAHLANQVELDADQALLKMARYWFDARWLDVLRFAVVTLQHESVLRDAMLRAVLDADDRYGDLLHRPEFVTAQLLESLDSAEAGVVGPVVECMERLILHEPALSDAAAEALLLLGRHAPAAGAIERFARGGDLAAAFADRDPSGDAQSPVFRWRLRAISALATARDQTVALQVLATLPAEGFNAQLEVCAARARLGDFDDAVAALKTLFEGQPEHGARGRIASVMDEIGAGTEVNQWLVALLADADGLDVATAKLARARGVLADDAPQWAALFARAVAIIEGLDAAAMFAPPEASEAVYAACDLCEHTPLPAARALLAASLRHPALVWFAGPRVGRLVPDLAAEAAEAMTRYILDMGYGSDRSRRDATLAQLCDESDDALAGPALLRLLQSIEMPAYWFERAAESLARRGRAADALAVLRPQIELPPGVDDRHPDDASERRSLALSTAERIARASTHPWLDALYRSSGDAPADARRLIDVWNASGVAGVARHWFESFASDEAGRAFLMTLAAHDRDTLFTDCARHALGGNVLDDGPEPEREDDETSRRPPTADEVTSELDAMLGRGVEAGDGYRPARPGEVSAQLERIAEVAGREIALRHADAWVRSAVPPEGPPDAAAAECLAERLDHLSGSELWDARWLEMAVEVARRLPPSERKPLIDWLRRHA